MSAYYFPPSPEHFLLLTLQPTRQQPVVMVASAVVPSLLIYDEIKIRSSEHYTRTPAIIQTETARRRYEGEEWVTAGGDEVIVDV